MPTNFTSRSTGDLIQATDVDQFIAPINNLETGVPWWAGQAASTNGTTFTATLTPTLATLNAGQLINFTAQVSNLGPATLAVNGLAAAPVLQNGAPLANGALRAGVTYQAVYDGSSWNLQGSSSTARSGSAVTNYAGPMVTAPALAANLLSTFSSINLLGGRSAINWNLLGTAPTSSFNYNAILLSEPRGKYVYFLTASFIQAFAIGASGLLTSIASYNQATSEQGACSADGNWMVVANGSSLLTFSIGPNGSLALASTVTTTGSINQIVCEPSGRFVYVSVTASGASSVQGFSLDSSGTLNSLGILATGGNLLACYPSGRYLFLGNSSSTGISICEIENSGNLKMVGSASSSQTSNYSMKCNPTGTYLFIAGGNSTIQAFTVGAEGSLTAAATSSVVGAAFFDFDPSGTICVQTTGASRYAYIYNVSENGAMSGGYIITANGSSPGSVVFEPSGQFFYYTDFGPPASVHCLSLTGVQTITSTGSGLALGNVTSGTWAAPIHSTGYTTLPANTVSPGAVSASTSGGLVYRLVYVMVGYAWGVIDFFYNYAPWWGVIYNQSYANTSFSTNVVVGSNGGSGKLSIYQTSNSSGIYINNGTSYTMEYSLQVMGGFPNYP